MKKENNQYDFKKIENYWQSYWEDNKIFKAKDFEKKLTYYVLDMFPYPSGAGLHIGHPSGYTATDIIGRYKKANGYNVMHPIGWDAFGLPSEQHAILTGISPSVNTKKNITNFKRQLKRIGFGFDWEREINTTDENYYKWTQWIFVQLFKNGLAYIDKKPVWWCPELSTVLSNEEIINGKSERGGFSVERKNLSQWVLKITNYAEKLLSNLKELDWPESTKKQQIDWIGKSEGMEINFQIFAKKLQYLKIFTNRAELIFGCTYIAISPEHPQLKNIIQKDQSILIEKYINKSKNKSNLERTDLAKEISGEFTGSYVIHPINNTQIPIWVSDYVLPDLGTGCIIGIPAHNEKDYLFAKKFKLKVIQVVKSNKKEKIPFIGDQGSLINSDSFNDLNVEEGKIKISKFLIETLKGKFSINYKLNDWIFSRQRYWGEPFPIFWIKKLDFEKLLKFNDSPFIDLMPKKNISYIQNNETFYAIPMIDKELPVILPTIKCYKSLKNTDNPLSKEESWVNIWVNLKTGKIVNFDNNKPQGEEWVHGKRETNTMPQWAGSCWYYLRYLDPNNKNELISKSLESYWKTPDLYVGGGEHAVLHLLYARFWHHFLYDIGIVSSQEPFKKLFHQGIILGEMEYIVFYNNKNEYISSEFINNYNIDTRNNELVKEKKIPLEMIEKDNQHFILKNNPNIRVYSKCYKMSKSRGNVVNPDDIINEYGADALRLYEMFLGPLDASKPWNTNGLQGMVRFLKKIWRIYIDKDNNLNEKISNLDEESNETNNLLNITIKKVTQDIDCFKFNTAISQMMIFSNHLQKVNYYTTNTLKKYIQLLAPFAPHISEEIWKRLGHQNSITSYDWPLSKDIKSINKQITIIVQINGRFKYKLLSNKDIEKDDILLKVKNIKSIIKLIENKKIVKEIYIKNKILNLITD